MGIYGYVYYAENEKQIKRHDERLDIYEGIKLNKC